MRGRRRRCRRPAPPTTSTASATARSRSGGRTAKAADRAASRSARAYRPSCRWHRRRGRRRSWRGHRVSTLPFSVSKVLPPFLAALAPPEARRGAEHFAQAGAGRPPAAAPAARQRRPASACSRCSCGRSYWSAICGGIPHLAELVSTYLIILISAWPKLPISLQASSGRRLALAGGLDQLAALLRLFAQRHESLHAVVRRAARLAADRRRAPNAEPEIGAAPVAGNELAPAGADGSGGEP